MPNTYIQTGTHVCLKTWIYASMHPYITHTFQARNIILELSIFMTCRFAYFKNFHSSVNMLILEI